MYYHRKHLHKCKLVQLLQQKANGSCSEVQIKSYDKSTNFKLTKLTVAKHPLGKTPLTRPPGQHTTRQPSA